MLEFEKEWDSVYPPSACERALSQPMSALGPLGGLNALQVSLESWSRLASWDRVYTVCLPAAHAQWGACSLFPDVGLRRSSPLWWLLQPLPVQPLLTLFSPSRLFLSTFTLAVSAGAVLLLPFSIISNEILLSFHSKLLYSVAEWLPDS